MRALPSFMRASLMAKRRAHNPDFQVRILGAQPICGCTNNASILRGEDKSLLGVRILILSIAVG